MATTDSIFQRALSNTLREIFDGPPGEEAFLLNPGDPGPLFRPAASRRNRRIDCAAVNLSGTFRTAKRCGEVISPSIFGPGRDEHNAPFDSLKWFCGLDEIP